MRTTLKLREKNIEIMEKKPSDKNDPIPSVDVSVYTSYPVYTKAL